MSLFRSIAQLLHILPPDSVPSSAPQGAWIAPQQIQQPTVAIGEACHPVMDAAQAQAHNVVLFHGMSSWGPLMGLALMALALVWLRFLKS